MLSSLIYEEKIALAGVVKWIISADHNDSIEGIGDFFKENNFGDFDKVYEDMDSRFDTVEEFKEFLATITNGDAQKLILDVAYDVAISDAYITNDEKKIMEEIKSIWNK